MAIDFYLRSHLVQRPTVRLRLFQFFEIGQQNASGGLFEHERPHLAIGSAGHIHVDRRARQLLGDRPEPRPGVSRRRCQLG